MKSSTKKIGAAVLCALFLISSTTNASAHAGVDTRGVVPTKGISSVILLRIGHGCTAPNGVTKVATHSVSVSIPGTLLTAPASAAMQIPGFEAVVIPSQETISAGVAQFNTVTWTAKDDIFDVNPVGFAEFGIRGNWAAAGKFWLDTVQTCREATTTQIPASFKKVTDPSTKKKVSVFVAATSKKTYKEYKLVWNIHDSSAASTMNADKTIENGPAPTVTIADVVK